MVGCSCVLTIKPLTSVRPGVPRILEGTLPKHLCREAVAQVEREPWVAYEEYMRTTRINISVRQVFPKGFDGSFQ